MEASRIIESITRTEEEKMLLLRVCDKLQRAIQREMPASTAFLSPHEQALTKQIIPDCSFYGGTALAERKIAFYLPEYLTQEDYFSDGPIACIRASFFEENAISHRDILGALMGTGIRRDAVGDLCLHERTCDIFVLSELVRYLLDNLTSAGRHHLKLEQIALEEAVKLPQKMKEIRITVSSMRFDGILSAAFHLSRGDTADAIRAGKAERNSLTCMKPDKMVEENDEISLRGSGKMKILGINGETRKGRIALTIGIYQ